LKKYTCSICGYVYDETNGDSDRGISPGTKWEDVPESWICPLCGAMKADFKTEKMNDKPDVQKPRASEHEEDSLRELSFGEVSSLCSNLSKGCTKQYLMEEAELFNQLAEFYSTANNMVVEGQLRDVSTLIEQDLTVGYVQANLVAVDESDRGALRALVWGEKVTRILNAILGRYEKKQEELLENTHIYVCDICGFIYIGDDLPEICPVCKVPNKKIIEVKRG